MSLFATPTHHRGPLFFISCCFQTVTELLQLQSDKIKQQILSVFFSLCAVQIEFKRGFDNFFSLYIYTVHFWQSDFPSNCIQNAQYAISDSLMFHNFPEGNAPEPTHSRILLGLMNHTAPKNISWLGHPVFSGQELHSTTQSQPCQTILIISLNSSFFYWSN